MDPTSFLCIFSADFPNFAPFKNHGEPRLFDLQSGFRLSAQTAALARFDLALPGGCVSGVLWVALGIASVVRVALLSSIHT